MTAVCALAAALFLFVKERPLAATNEESPANVAPDSAAPRETGLTVDITAD